MEKPFFYVVVPVYKAERYLCECVDSILKQTYDRFQLILVNDGSPDESGKICDAYARNDSRVHVIHQENAGVLAAREKGIQYALKQARENDYLLFADSDDRMKPCEMSVLSDAIYAKGSDILYFRSADLYPDGSEVPYNPPEMPVGDVTDKAFLYRRFFLNAGYNAMWRKACRAGLFSGIDHSAYFGNLRISEDLLESMPLIIRSKKVTFLEDVLYLYRQNAESLTNTYPFDTYNNDFFLYQMVWDVMKQEGVWTEEDFHAYQMYFLNMLRPIIWMIAKFLVPTKEKRVKYQEITQYPLFQSIVEYIPKSHWDLRLIAHERYFLISILGDFLGILRGGLRMIRRLRSRG